MNKPHYHNKVVYPLPKEQGRPKPKIPIRITNFETGQSEDINALIDTGSDYCVFPSFITKSVGHELGEDDIKQDGLRGISGVPIETYVHGFKISLLDEKMEKVLCTVDTIAYTVLTQKLTPILGYAGFLTNFKVSVDYKKNKIILKW